MTLASIGISLVVTVAACAVYFRVLRGRMRRELGTEEILGRFRSEVSGLITEMNATTERNVALLESRIREASDVLERMEKAMDVLKGEIAAARQMERTYTELGRSRPIDITVEGEVESSGEGSPAADPIDFESLSTRDKALVLYRRGEGSDAIAARLGMSRGEVELIISLHDRRR